MKKMNGERSKNVMHENITIKGTQKAVIVVAPEYTSLTLIPSTTGSDSGNSSNLLAMLKSYLGKELTIGSACQDKPIHLRFFLFETLSPKHLVPTNLLFNFVEEFSFH